MTQDDSGLTLRQRAWRARRSGLSGASWRLATVSSAARNGWTDVRNARLRNLAQRESPPFGPVAMIRSTTGGGWQVNILLQSSQATLVARRS